MFRFYMNAARGGADVYRLTQAITSCKEMTESQILRVLVERGGVKRCA